MPDYPKDWPENAELDGKPIPLAEVDALPPRVRERVTIALPGNPKFRAWRDDDAPTHEIRDGKLVVW